MFGRNKAGYCATLIIRKKGTRHKTTHMTSELTIKAWTQRGQMLRGRRGKFAHSISQEGRTVSADIQDVLVPVDWNIIMRLRFTLTQCYGHLLPVAAQQSANGDLMVICINWICFLNKMCFFADRVEKTTVISGENR